MPTNKDISKILARISESPGVYKMIDKERRVIYVGKANNLAKRVKQYFKKEYEHSSRTKKLVENISTIETIAVDSEIEAMILEHNIIKQLQPKYNVVMKDDKSYVYIKITREDFPRIQIVREIKKDKAKYIGPKTAAHKVKETLKVLKKIFPFRHCGLDIEMIDEKIPDKKGEVKHEVKVTNKVLKYPCLDYYIKRCVAPCIGKCSIVEYKQIIQNVENFLDGKADDILKNLHNQMQTHAENREFEKAGKIRDKLKKIEAILEKQKVSDPNRKDTDIINYCITRDHAYINLFQIRDGQLIGQENFTLIAKEIDDTESEEVLSSFLKHYYELATDIPKEILIPHEVEDKKEIEEFLSKQVEKKVQILIPQKGTKNKLLEMSLNNARIFADRSKPSWQEESDLTIKATQELQKLLKIPKPLHRIECYDISHLSGTDTVGSMIVFENGAPKNNLYRKFQIRTVVGKPDDFKSMEEILTRRFSRLTENLQSKDYRFRKVKKSDQDFIEKTAKVDLANIDRQFYLLEKKSKPIGIIASKLHSEKVAELSNLWLDPKERGKKLGQKLVKEMIQKTKAKRIYGVCNPELKEYYFLMGFEEIKKLPSELESKYKDCQKLYDKPTMIVYDRIKHTVDISFGKIPDLVIIDGGKGQLSSATKVIKDLDLKIPYISLAKRLEEIFVPGAETSIILPRNNEALKLLQRARDEAHRFAISYNKKLRSKKLLQK